MAKMNQPGTDRGEKDETGEREPKGSKARDAGGERSGRLVNGVAMGKADGGAKKSDQFNTGRTEGICYEHKKEGY